MPLQNTVNRQYQGVEYLISNLSKVKEELESPSLSQYNNLMQQISSINIDPQSNQVFFDVIRGVHFLLFFMVF